MKYRKNGGPLACR